MWTYNKDQIFQRGFAKNYFYFIVCIREWDKYQPIEMGCSTHRNHDNCTLAWPAEKHANYPAKKLNDSNNNGRADCHKAKARSKRGSASGRQYVRHCCHINDLSHPTHALAKNTTYYSAQRKLKWCCPFALTFCPCGSVFPFLQEVEYDHS